MYIVGIGASSGGLAALQVLLGSMPAQPGFACVIVMHLSPEHESHLPELLQKFTPMPVTQVTSTIALELNHIYVIPPNANLDSIDTHLRLSELEERRIERAPINHFLRTLAQTHYGTAIGVVLTGAGADGSMGLRYISSCGGLTIAQDPQEARFPSMPRNAIATGVVDLVLPLQRIPEKIAHFCATRPQLQVSDNNDTIGQAIVDLEQTTHQDFRVYRREKLLEGLRRRMQLHHVTSMREYLDLLAQRRQEVQALADDLLLAPTEFFGDTEAFREIEQHIIPELLDRKTHENSQLRVWTLGCSTGEEAYSLAILVAEALERRNRRIELQVFASDLSAKSLDRARAGLYPHEIGASVSPQRLARFFMPERGSFRITREIRDAVLFASHNLFRDPPFAHIDVIVCRRLLADLQPAVRRAVLHLFHYALAPEGRLLLGEGDEASADEFRLVPGASGCLFRKIRGAIPSH